MPDNSNEPVLRPMLVDLTGTSERVLVPRGELVYTIFVSSLPAGIATFELSINAQWIPLGEGDTLECGDCNPTQVGVLVRSTPALPGFFASLIVGATGGAQVTRG